MLSLLPLLAVPLIVALGFFLVHRDTFTFKELAALEVGMSGVLLVGFLLARDASMSDVELWSGRISGKHHRAQGCCHCRTECRARNNKGACISSVRVCSHGRDWRWDLSVSTGDSIAVKTCEPDRDDVPSAWSAAYVGEPAVVERTYRNYLLADPESVLRQITDFTGKAPAWPGLRRLYHADRALSVDQALPEPAAWNKAIAEVNAQLGGRKEVNVILVATKGTDPRYAEVVARDWLYGKKNDLIFVVGREASSTQITWARVVTISRVEELKVRAREELVGLDLADIPGTATKLQALVETGFHRTPFSEFEYLASAAKPSNTSLVVLYVLALAFSVGGSLFFIATDPFGDHQRASYFGYRPRPF